MSLTCRVLLRNFALWKLSDVPDGQQRVSSLVVALVLGDCNCQESQELGDTGDVTVALSPTRSNSDQ